MTRAQSGSAITNHLGRWFTGRRRGLLRRVAVIALTGLLLLFWAATVYTLLVGLWGRLAGVALRDETGAVWLGWIEVLFIGSALLSAWPVRRWLATRIAHLMEDNGDNAYAMISRLSQQMDAIETANSLLQTVVRLLAETLDVAHVSLTTARDGQSFAHGAPTATPPIRVPLRYNHNVLGTLTVTPRVVGGMPLHVDAQLLGDLARQVSLTLYAAHLSAELQESRRRIVTAHEEGSRQLRRDLHDGLGPALATLTMQADTAREFLRHDPDTAERLLAQLAEQAQSTVAEVRRIVHGLRPPALDDVGLFGALEVLMGSFASPTLTVRVEMPASRPRLSAALEVAVYRIVQEAMTNVVRHAHARHATLTLVCDERRLHLLLCDDGAGLPAQPGAGLGLQSMRARAEELGGILAIQSSPSSGTCISAEFPLEPGDIHDRTDPYPDL